MDQYRRHRRGHERDADASEHKQIPPRRWVVPNPSEQRHLDTPLLAR